MDVENINRILEETLENLVDGEAAKKLGVARGEKKVSRPKKSSKLQKLKAKYINPKTGRFKGKTGERFKSCVAYMKAKGDVQDPEALCGKIARMKGMARGGKNYGK